ncbi:dihydrolipoyl dehydrogenase family protein [Desulfonatronum parangueonense]
MAESCDLLVVGAGPAGYAAALEAASLGRDVVLVEKNLLGGTCLNWGCIPTKLFLGATQAIAEIRAQSRLRLGAGDFAVDMAALQKRKTSLLNATRQAMIKTLQAAGVRLVMGRAELHDPEHVLIHTVDQGETRIRFQRLILALGSVPSWPPLLQPDGKNVLTSYHVLDLEQVPKTLAVVGAGAIGLEMAQFFQRMGSRITLIEAMERIAPSEDPEICAQLASMLKRLGMDVLAGTAVTGLERGEDLVRIQLSGERHLDARKVLVAVGRRPNNRFPGLEKAIPGHAGAATRLETDAHLRLTERIYAVGDCNGRVLLAHAAEDQGRFAARHAAGAVQRPYAPGAIPFCMYGDPEVFRVGPTPDEAVRSGLECTVSRAMLAANPVAQAAGAPHGLVKVLWSGPKVIGISAVGHGVLHLTAAATIMVDQGWTKEQSEQMIFAHPTLDETLRQALLAPLEAVQGSGLWA